MGGGSSIGRLGLGIAGAAIGSYFGSPQLGFMAGSLIGGLVLREDAGGDSNGPFEQDSILDIAIQSQAYGKMLPILYGSTRLAGNIVWSTDKIEHEIRNETQVPSASGGKGGGGSTTTQVSIQKYYTASFFIALCEGPIATISKIWADGTLIYDESQDGVWSAIASNSDQPATIDPNIIVTNGISSPGSVLTQEMIFYLGTDAQEPSVTMEAEEGVGEVPSYKGIAGVLVKDIDLGMAGRVPNLTFEVHRQLAPIGAPVDVIIGNDLIHALYRTSIFDNRSTNGTFVTISELVGDVTQKTATALRPQLMTRNLVNSGQTEFFGVWSETSFETFSATGEALLPEPLEIRTAAQVTAELALSIEDANVVDYVAFAALNNTDEIVFVEVINLSDVSITPTRLTVGSGPKRIAVQDTTHAIVTSENTNNVTEFNPFAGTSIGTNDTGASTWGAAYSGAYYVSQPSMDRVVKLGTPNTNIPVGATPTELEVASDGYIWVINSGDRTLSRINPSTDAVQTFLLTTQPTHLKAHISGGKMWASAQNDNRIYLIDIDGTLDVDRDIAAGPGRIDVDSDGQAWVACEGARLIVGVSGTGDEVEFEVQADENSLGCVVYDVNKRAGLDPGQINVTRLNNDPVNMLIATPAAAREILETLALGYQFVGLEADEQIQYYLKGGSSIATLSDESLGTKSDEPDVLDFEIIRTEEIPLPTQVNVSHIDPNRNYEGNTQSSFLRHSYNSNNPLSVTLPFAITASVARKIAEVILVEAWTARQHYKFKLSKKWIKLLPFDVITIVRRGIPYQIRVIETNPDPNTQIIECTGINHRSFLYENFSALPGDTPTSADLIAEEIDTGMNFVDTPPQDEYDTSWRYHSALYQTEPDTPGKDWKGATLHRQMPSDPEFLQVDGSIISAIVGDVSVATPDGRIDTWDITTVITVVLNFGTLESHTDLEVLNGANRCLIGSEMIQFVTATLISGTTYQLSRLLRGRKGTEQFTSTHVTNERFILLDSHLIVSHPVTYPSWMRNIALDHKVVPYKGDISSEPTIQFTPLGVNQIAWAPTYVSSSQNVPSAGDWTFYWNTRMRFRNELLNGGGAIYDYDHVGFKVNIYSSATYDTILRTFTITSVDNADDLKSQVYTAAQQTTDFGTTKNDLAIGIIETNLNGDGYERRLLIGDAVGFPFTVNFNLGTVDLTGGAIFTDSFEDD